MAVIQEKFDSQSTPGKFYTAWIDPETGDQGCNCWPCRTKGTCKHLTALLYMQRRSPAEMAHALVRAGAQLSYRDEAAA